MLRHPTPALIIAAYNLDPGATSLKAWLQAASWYCPLPDPVWSVRPLLRHTQS